MDVRLSSEQLALRASAAQVADRLGPGAVSGLTDTERRAKLDAAVEASGWRELRADRGDGAPWASAVEAALVAEELGRGLVDTAFFGPVLATELRRLAGAPSAASAETVAFRAGLGALARSGPGEATGGTVLEEEGSSAALALESAPGGWRLVRLPVASGSTPTDPTRPSGSWRGPSGEAVGGQRRLLGDEDLERWESLALALSCADLLGVMRGALDMACDYARTRHQFGVPVGSFQALQHLLADACVALEGSRSVALHAAWSVDALPPPEALAACALAKAYCARAARTVCETAVQVHGGVGNTWDCLAHLYLRRALLSSALLGGVGENLERVLAAHGLGS